MPVDVFLCAGEASGDLQASLLMRAMQRQKPGLRFAGVGGARLRAAGAQLWQDSVAAGWASIGHLRAYVKIPWLLSVAIGLAARLYAVKPKLLVFVDFGAFNLRLLEMLRFCGYAGRALYYFPPGAWLDDERQARKVTAVARALTPFEHQASFYRSLSLPVEYFGHPLVSEIAPRATPPRNDRPCIAVLPGSRVDEIRQHAPVLAQAATMLASSGGARFRVVASSPERAAELRAYWPAQCGGAKAIELSDAAAAVSDADVAWCASGTAVLEVMLRDVPQIAFYRLSETQYRYTVARAPKIVHGPITLPNLVAGRRVVDELLQYDFEPARLVALTQTFLSDARARDRQLRDYAEVRRMLGPPDALARIGAFAAGLLA